MAETVFDILVLMAYTVLVSLPGIFVTWIGWKLSRRIASPFTQIVLRATMVAVALTPSFWGHAGVVPAIVLAFALQGRERLAGIVPMLIAGAAVFVVLIVHLKKKTSAAQSQGRIG